MGEPENLRFGLIVYVETKDSRLYLILKHRDGYWDFCKGGAIDIDGGDPLETCLRELEEETKIERGQVEILTHHGTVEAKYCVGEEGEERRDKTIILRVARVLGDTPLRVTLQHEEIKDSGWMTYTKAINKLGRPEAKLMLEAAEHRIREDR